MTDLLVVGAGVAGGSVAFAAARRGASVTVVDDGRPGRATPAGAGIIAPWATELSGEAYQLYADGADAYPMVMAALAEAGVDDVGYARNGALVVRSGPDLAAMHDRLTERTAASAVAGRPESVDEADARRLFPPLRGGSSGIHVPGGARVDGRRLAAGLLDGVRHHAGEVLRGAVSIVDGHVVVDGRRVRAETTVVAAGAWVTDVLPRRQLPVSAQRGQICHLRVDGADTGRWPSVLPPADHYIVPFEHGRVVVGATRESGIDDVRITAGGVRDVLARALDVAPGLEHATLIETRVGLRPSPTDGHRPVIGPVGTGTWVIAGFGAIGLTIGPTVGERVAEMLLGGDDDPLLRPFRPR